MYLTDYGADELSDFAALAYNSGKIRFCGDRSA
jgi:hypothetical protein